MTRPLIARRRSFLDGFALPDHAHAHGRFLFCGAGMAIVSTKSGAWLAPPGYGLWIPPGIEHDVRMVGTVDMRVADFEDDIVAAMTDHCHVICVSALLRNLLVEAMVVPDTYAEESRDAALMTLLLHELRRLPASPLSVPLPSCEVLGKLCRDFLAHPNPRETIDSWSGKLNVSRRTFTRMFKQATGLSFSQWRQRACVIFALPRLVAGEKAAAVAATLGYGNSASFAVMFKRWLGATPGSFRVESLLESATISEVSAR